MKRRLFCFLLLGSLVFSSCAAPVGEGPVFVGTAVDSEGFAWSEGEFYSSLAWDEAKQSGGGIVPWDTQTAQSAPFADTEVFGIARYGGAWYGCEKKSGVCNGDGAQLLRWDEEEKQQKKITDLCSCRGSCYLLTEGWVFYTKRCEVEGIVQKGVYGYHPEEDRYCFFGGEAIGLGLRDGQPHYLLLSEEGAALYRIRLGESPASERVALWQELPCSVERLKQGEVLLGTGAAIFLEDEGFCLLEEGREARFFSVKACEAAVGRDALFYGSASALYRLRFGSDSAEKLYSSSAKDARFRLLVRDDGCIAFELSNHRAVDVLLWRWEWEELLLWQEGKGVCTLRSRSRCEELPQSQLPLFIGFPK